MTHDFHGSWSRVTGHNSPLSSVVRLGHGSTLEQGVQLHPQFLALHPQFWHDETKMSLVTMNNITSLCRKAWKSEICEAWWNFPVEIDGDRDLIGMNSLEDHKGFGALIWRARTATAEHTDVDPLHVCTAATLCPRTLYNTLWYIHKPGMVANWPMVWRTRSSAIAVIADRTACSILTLFIVSTTSRPLNKKSVCCQSANQINNYCGSASANSQSAHLSARAVGTASWARPRRSHRTAQCHCWRADSQR